VWGARVRTPKRRSSAGHAWTLVSTISSREYISLLGPDLGLTSGELSKQASNINRDRVFSLVFGTSLALPRIGTPGVISSGGKSRGRCGKLCRNTRGGSTGGQCDGVIGGLHKLMGDSRLQSTVIYTSNSPNLKPVKTTQAAAATSAGTTPLKLVCYSLDLFPSKLTPNLTFSLAQRATAPSAKSRKAHTTPTSNHLCLIITTSLNNPTKQTLQNPFLTPVADGEAVVL
jgi:hypothetical protein